MKASDQTVLSLHKKKIITLDRIKITHDEHRTWTLRIERITKDDQGCYMCQVNTASMIKQLGCITVLGKRGKTMLIIVKTRHFLLKSEKKGQTI